MKITVLILTHNRPNYLNDCLASLKCQSRRDLIAEVILSENSANLESQKIAESYLDDLPIRFIHQPDKPTAREHGLSLLNHIRTDFVAIIADDDMWSPYHLQDSLNCYNQYPEAVAFFGEAIRVIGADCKPSGLFGPGSVPSSNQSTSYEPYIIWTATDMALNCTRITPLNIWSCVAKTHVFCKAASQSTGDPIYGVYPQNDRLFLWELAAQGPIVISKNISLYYRTHPTSEIALAVKDKSRSIAEEDLIVTREIHRRAIEMGIDVYDLLDKFLCNKPNNPLFLERDAHLYSTIEYVLNRRDEPPQMPKQSSITLINATRAALKSLLRELSPPLLWRLASRSRAELSANQGKIS